MNGVPALVDSARTLRRTMSLPEVLPWQGLRRRPGGLKFRRQHALGGYVLDLYCASAKLAVEIDGRAHDAPEQALRDVDRDAWLAARGVRCLRIAALRVLDNAPGVAEWLGTEAASPDGRPLHHRKSDGPPPRKGGEDQGLSPCR